MSDLIRDWAIWEAAQEGRVQRPETCGAERITRGNAHDPIKKPAFSMETTSGGDQPWGKTQSVSGVFQLR